VKKEKLGKHQKGKIMVMGRRGRVRKRKLGPKERHRKTNPQKKRIKASEKKKETENQRKREIGKKLKH